MHSLHSCTTSGSFYDAILFLPYSSLHFHSDYCVPASSPNDSSGSLIYSMRTRCCYRVNHVLVDIMDRMANKANPSIPNTSLKLHKGKVSVIWNLTWVCMKCPYQTGRWHSTVLEKGCITYAREINSLITHCKISNLNPIEWPSSP